MSQVYSVYDGEAPQTFDDAMDALLSRDAAFDRHEAPTPGIRTFVETLLARWPDIGDEAGADSPWADGPMINNAAGSVIHFSVSYSRLPEVEPFLIDVVKTLGLVMLDQGEGRVLVPDIPASTAEDERVESKGSRRRWFRRKGATEL